MLETDSYLDLWNGFLCYTTLLLRNGGSYLDVGTTVFLAAHSRIISLSIYCKLSWGDIRNALQQKRDRDNMDSMGPTRNSPMHPLHYAYP